MGFFSKSFCVSKEKEVGQNLLLLLLLFSKSLFYEGNEYY
jgi:hypothetical protein